MADRVSISFKLGGTLSADTWLELASVIASEGLSIEWYGPAFEPDADAIRADLAARKIEAVIPGRSNRRVKIEHDRTLYKQRNRIERVFGHSRSTAPLPPDTINSPTASSAWSTSPPPDAGSNLSTPPSSYAAQSPS